MKFHSTDLLAIIYASVLLIFTACGVGAGNITDAVRVPSNLRFDIIKQYNYIVDQEHNVPGGLKQFVTHYDHLNTYGYYFPNTPEAVYTVSYASECRVISIYYPKSSLWLIGDDVISDAIKTEVRERVLSQVIYPIWKKATSDQLPDSLIYIFPSCKSYKICDL